MYELMLKKSSLFPTKDAIKNYPLYVGTTNIYPLLSKSINGKSLNSN